jgi:hypothetical protein
LDEPVVLKSVPFWKATLPPLVTVNPPLKVVSPVTPKVDEKLPAWVTVKAPLLVVVTPVLPKLIDVALVLPRFNAAAASTVLLPELVVKLDAALPVKETAPPDTVMPALPVSSWVTVNAPLLVVVMPVLPKLIDVALVLPRLNAAAASTVRLPELVVKLDAALPVKETAPPDTVMPALPVSKLENVLAPAKVWVVVFTRPG